MKVMSMMDTTTSNWHEANQRQLGAALALVRHALEHHAQKVGAASATESNSITPGNEPDRIAPADASDNIPATFASDDSNRSSLALETLCIAFELSPFERDVLLLCAGIELE